MGGEREGLFGGRNRSSGDKVSTRWALMKNVENATYYTRNPPIGVEIARRRKGETCLQFLGKLCRLYGV